MLRFALPGLLFVIALFAPAMTGSAGAADKAVVNGMIKRGVTYLRAELKKGHGDGASTLAAYAILKAGGNPADPEVQKAIKSVRAKVVDGKYKPRSEVIYTLGVEMMLLEAAGGKAATYRPEMQAMVDFMVKNQASAGYWNYLGGDRHGDTSVTQYGILGLWAAARGGVKVPPAAWDRAASWLRATQKKDGGYRYRPTSDTDMEGTTSSMTVAGVATLLVTNRYLHPDRVAGANKKKKKKKVFSLNRHLRKIDTKTPVNKKAPAGSKKKPVAPADYKPTNSFNQINGAAANGFGWIAARFRPGQGRWPVYTLYGVERLAALMNNTKTIGRLNWFDAGVAWLKSNEKDGTWNDTTGKLAATSFAVLFLTRSTAKTLGHKVDLYGDGLLRGGTGLPDDLSSIDEGGDGKIKKRKITGSIDNLLSELTNPQTKLDVPELQKAIVKKIQLGNREDWLKPKKRKQLLEMAEHPKPDVRMVAIWALGRTGNIDIVTILMDTLEKDPDLGVAIEARNALCWLSRKPKGFGLPNHPKSLFPDNATKEQRLAVIKKWRKEAVEKWKKWYLTVRPYKERDDVRDTNQER